jgi:hypothetical protein
VPDTSPEPQNIHSARNFGYERQKIDGINLLTDLRLELLESLVYYLEAAKPSRINSDSDVVFNNFSSAVWEGQISVTQ